MLNNKAKRKTSKKNFWQYIRKNGLSILFGIAIVLLIISPDAKSWVLRQLISTGFFNADLDNKNSKIHDDTVTGFNFQDKKGNVINTSSLRGKVVFINFWASWCPPCRAEFPSILSLYNKFENNPGLFFLMINEDNNLSAAEAFLKKEDFALPLYRLHTKVPDAIYSGTLPTTLVLDKKGKIRFRHEGFANYGAEAFMNQIEDLIKE